MREVRNPCYVNQGSVKNDNSSLGDRGQLMPSDSAPFHAMPYIYIFLDLQQYYLSYDTKNLYISLYAKFKRSKNEILFHEK